MSTTAARLFQPGSVAPAGAYRLGIGHPDPDAFPAELLDIDFLASAERRTAALSYGPPEGSGILIEHLRATVLREEPAGRTVLTHGSGDAIDLAMRVFSKRGGIVLAEDPAFPGLATSASNAGIEVVGVPSSAEGIDPEAVADTIAMAVSAGQRIEALYVMPTGSNPRGTVTSLARRERLIEIVARAGVLIVEDDAYAHLRFDDHAPIPSLHALAPDRVLNLKTLSKIAFPGLRLAAACGPDDLLDDLLAHKPVGGTAPFGSEVITSLFEHIDYDAYVTGLQARYRARRDLAARALRTHLPEARFTSPAAGFFVWAEVPGVDAQDLHLAAAAAGVEILPGSAFAIDQVFANHIRITYSFEAPERIAEGISILGDVVHAR